MLKINRDRAEMSFLSENEFGALEKRAKVSFLDGLLGCIKLNGGFYFICITDKVAIGTIKGGNVWKTAGFRIVRSAPNLDVLAVSHNRDDAKYVRLLENYLKHNAFYFSYDFDLTWPIAKQPPALMISGCNASFLFNGHLIDGLLGWAKRHFTDESSLHLVSAFALPVIQGFVGIQNFPIGESSVQLCLISRRAPQRSGTRFLSRGCDENGNVSNFVETEQILLSETSVFSFLIIRGSLPMVWNHQMDLKYKPEIRVCKTSSINQQVAQIHVAKLTDLYGNSPVLINLVDGGSGSYERKLLDAFSEVLDDRPSPLRSNLAAYFHFDFHAECKEKGWGHLDDLAASLQPQLDAIGYWELNSASPSSSRSQLGVIRVNCVDCLDRTNVFQSVLAKRVLLGQLIRARVLSPEDSSLIHHPEAEIVFKNLWADNGDAISWLYSGTFALKSDFIRTGRRTFFGVVLDGVKSLQRYFVNHFMQGKIEDASRLISGAFKVSRNIDSPFKGVKAKRSIKVFLLLGALAYFLLNFLFYACVQRNWPKSLVCLGIIWIIRHEILANGHLFVSVSLFADPVDSLVDNSGKLASSRLSSPSIPKIATEVVTKNKKP